MKIGLYDVDSSNFPNLPLMKISAYHKAKGDEVEFLQFMEHYDKVYVSKVFGDEYSKMDMTTINADEVVFGGTGFAITIENGKEVYHKNTDKDSRILVCVFVAYSALIIYLSGCIYRCIGGVQIKQEVIVEHMGCNM